MYPVAAANKSHVHDRSVQVDLTKSIDLRSFACHIRPERTEMWRGVAEPASLRGNTSEKTQDHTGDGKQVPCIANLRYILRWALPRL